MKKTSLMVSTLALCMGIAMMPFAATAAESVSSLTQQNIPSLAPMLEKVMPAVVSISVEGNVPVKDNEMTDQLQRFFGDNSPLCQEGSPFLGSPLCQSDNNDANNNKQNPRAQDPRQQAQRPFQGLGSGVIIDAVKGYVVTNNHVIDNADKIQVQLNDGRKYDAKIVGRDPRTDIALLQLVNFKDLTAIPIADSDKLRIGDYTVAIGNPYGLGQTVTSGIVSALGRSGLNIENYENFIQTDAAINRGNSGGALVNLRGELIGINTAILAPDGGNIGIGFAIPSNMVKSLTQQMVEYGQVKRGELGVMGTELTPELSQAMNITEQKGAFISQVLPHSAAAKAGIKAGDVIVSMNGQPISSFAAFRAQIGTMPPGSKMTLGVIRDSKPVTIEVALEQSQASQVDSGSLYQGIEGAELSNYHKDNVKGVLIDNVKDKTAAAQMGLKKGDIILGVNQTPTPNLGDLRKILDTKPAVLAINIKRGDDILYLLTR